MDGLAQKKKIGHILCLDSLGSLTYRQRTSFHHWIHNGLADMIQLPRPATWAVASKEVGLVTQSFHLGCKLKFGFPLPPTLKPGILSLPSFHPHPHPLSSPPSSYIIKNIAMSEFLSRSLPRPRVALAFGAMMLFSLSLFNASTIFSAVTNNRPHYNVNQDVCTGIEHLNRVQAETSTSNLVKNRIAKAESLYQKQLAHRDEFLSEHGYGKP